MWVCMHKYMCVCVCVVRVYVHVWVCKYVYMGCVGGSVYGTYLYIYII